MSKKVKYYEDEDVELRLEFDSGLVFVHLVFNKVSKSIVDKVLRIWAEIKAGAWYNGYEAVYTYTGDSRMKRLFPGAVVVGHIYPNDQKMEVLKWDLN